MKKRMVKTKIGDITFHSVPVPMFSEDSKGTETKGIRDALYPSGNSGEVAISNDTFIKWTKDIFTPKDTNVPGKLYVYSEETKQFCVDQGFPADRIVILKPVPEEGWKR